MTRPRLFSTRGWLGLLTAAIAAAAGLLNKDKLPPICMFQFGNCGNPGNGNPGFVITVGPSQTQSPPISPKPEPLPPLANEAFSKDEYLKQVLAAKTALSIIQSDLPIQFPMGVHSPIGSINMRNHSSSSLKVIGYLDQESRKVKPVTPSELLGLLNQHGDSLYAQVSGNISSEQNTLLTLDLVVFDSKTQAVKTVDSVNAGDVVRDAVNSTLNETLQESQLENFSLNR